MEFVLSRQSGSHLQGGIGIDVNPVAAHQRVPVRVNKAEVHRTRIKKAPFQNPALGQLHGGLPQPCRVGRIGRTDYGGINDRVNLFSDAVHERGAIVHVAVLLAAIGLQRMRVDNGSAGFDACYALVDDLLGQNWNSGLDPSRRGSVDGDFNTGLLNHDPPALTVGFSAYKPQRWPAARSNRARQPSRRFAALSAVTAPRSRTRQS